MHLIEVKRWASDAVAHPLETITRTRRLKIRRAMLQFAAEWEREHDPGTGHPADITGTTMKPLESGLSFDLVWLKDEQVFYYENLVV